MYKKLKSDYTSIKINCCIKRVKEFVHCCVIKRINDYYMQEKVFYYSFQEPHLNLNKAFNFYTKKTANIIMTSIPSWRVFDPFLLTLSIGTSKI